MQYLQFIIESNSNKKLDTLSKEIITTIRRGAGVKAGPIPFKGKRIIYYYNPSVDVINRLIDVKVPKKASVTVYSLENSY